MALPITISLFKKQVMTTITEQTSNYNNLDKMYFLKQYFKNFDYTLSKRHSLLSKKITPNH